MTDVSLIYRDEINDRHLKMNLDTVNEDDDEILVFNESYAVDLPSETTVYSTGPYHKRYSHQDHYRHEHQLKPHQLENDPSSKRPIIVYPIHCNKQHPQENECKAKSGKVRIVATSQQRVRILSTIPPHVGVMTSSTANPNWLHTKMKRFQRKQTESKSQSRPSVIAYSNTDSSYNSSDWLLEAYIYSCDIITTTVTTNNTPNPLIIDGTMLDTRSYSDHTTTINDKTKTYTLTIQASSSSSSSNTSINPQDTKGSLKDKVMSEIELSFTPLRLYLCPWTVVHSSSSKTSSTTNSSIHLALLFIGCLEEPYLKTYHIRLLTTTTSTINPTILCHEPCVLVQEVNYHFQSNTHSIAIPSSLTSCFNTTSISLSSTATSTTTTTTTTLASSSTSSTNTFTGITGNTSSSNQTTMNIQEGHEKRFLPSSYWDALLAPHVHTFLSSTSSSFTGEGSFHSIREETISYNQQHHDHDQIQQPQQQQQQQQQRSNVYQSYLPLAFASPVLGIHSLHVEHCTLPFSSDTSMDHRGNIYYLAISCQDGTIRVITFSVYPTTHDSYSDMNLSYYIYNVSEMIEDGPIVAITLSVASEPKLLPTILLTIGSMCGTTCQYHQSDPYLHFQGPDTIGWSLWNPSLDIEDAITAIEGFDILVVVGTCSGRIYMFQKQRSSPLYIQTLEQNLYYPIHSIVIQRLANDERSVEMIVSTRKSVHLFRQGQFFKNKILADKILEQIHKLK